MDSLTVKNKTEADSVTKPNIDKKTTNPSENGKLDEKKSSSIEDLVPKEVKDEMYFQRYEILKGQLEKIKIDELLNQLKPEDLIDQFCDPDHPVRVTFNDISAAAYRIKGGVENTPCTVRRKTK